MIQQTYESCVETGYTTIVATDDARIATEVVKFGGKYILTPKDCPTGTDRCAVAMEILQKNGVAIDCVINVQGDTPFVPVELIHGMADVLKNNEYDVVTAHTSFLSTLEIYDVNRVKMWMYGDRAVWFSRRYEPHSFCNGMVYKHIGIYAFTADTLHTIHTQEPVEEERKQRLEQLRWLQNGCVIHSVYTDQFIPSIDTPDDLRKINTSH